MSDFNKDNVKKYFYIINRNSLDEELIDFCIDEIIDRTEIYLNRTDLPSNLERILAGVLNNIVKRYAKEQSLTEEDAAATDSSISSISDNGQSISFSNELVNYFTTASDNELFTGVTSILNRYRRVKVVYPETNEATNE